MLGGGGGGGGRKRMNTIQKQIYTVHDIGAVSHMYHQSEKLDGVLKVMFLPKSSFIQKDQTPVKRAPRGAILITQIVISWFSDFSFKLPIFFSMCEINKRLVRFEFYCRKIASIYA